MSAYKDVEIRIRGAKAGGDGQPALHDVEVRVEGSGLWTGTSKLDLESLDPSEPEAYGAALGQQLSNPSLLRALDQAGLTRGDCLRLRLLIDDDVRAPHWIRWERLWIPIDGVQWPLAAHPNIAFTRYIPVERPDEDPPPSPAFHLLYAVSNPEGLTNNSIDLEKEISNFIQAFEQGAADRRLQVSVLPGRTAISAELRDRIDKQGWKLLAGPTTLRNVSKQLHDGFHGLHILAHGDFNPDTGVGSLLLEDDAGGKAVVADTELQSWITLDLQLVLFQACYSGAPPAEDKRPFTGLAPHLIRLGVPAAVAMQDEVTMDDARLFFFEFYRVLLNEGMVDVAVNQGRQVLRQRPGSDTWSIPALFSRLRGGRLWCADAFRQSLATLLENEPVMAREDPLPLQAIEHTRGLTNYDPIVGAFGPRFDLAKHMRDLVTEPGSTTVLTGGRGFAKATQLHCLFREFAKRFLRGEPGVAMPVLLSLADLVERTSEAWPVLGRVWAGEARESDAALLAGRQFLFLIDGEAELAGGAREIALEAIGRLGSLAGSSTMIVADEALLTTLGNHFEDATLLVVQPLEWPRVSAYLDALKTNCATSLQKQIRERGYVDLVSQPRFLQHMLELSARGVTLNSRRQILERICGMYLAKVNTQLVPRGCVEDAARRIAWQIQNSDSSQIAGSDIYPVLNSARAGRDFSLSELLHELVSTSRLLVPSGDEGVRFAYPASQYYFAAQYLAAATDRTRLLQDITATLGRLARIRRWEKVLVLLANLIPYPCELLREVLAGSPLLEGGQLLLATRCYQEAVAERGHTSDMNDVVDQMIDGLIWRSSWDERRTYADRQNALQALVELAVSYPPRRPQIVPHLVALACDPIPSHSVRANRERYDWSGIRQIAAIGAVRLFDETAKYLNEHRPELLEPVQAWRQFTENPTAICCLLARDDPRVSPIAAFALIQSDREADRQTLISSYERVQNLDVKWGIVEALGGLESAWVHECVVKPWIQKAANESADSSEVRQAHICYLIQTTSLAEDEARAFMAACLVNGTPWLQGRALRALAKLQDDDIETWLRPVCEQILAGDADHIDSKRMNTTAAHLSEATLRRSALVALTDIGDVHSLEVIRSSRTLVSDDYELRQVSFQVAEEIYWRLTGGLDNESYTGAAFQTAQKAS